jgi:hypothetical protein
LRFLGKYGAHGPRTDRCDLRSCDEFEIAGDERLQRSVDTLLPLQIRNVYLLRNEERFGRIRARHHDNQNLQTWDFVRTTIIVNDLKDKREDKNRSIHQPSVHQNNNCHICHVMISGLHHVSERDRSLRMLPGFVRKGKMSGNPECSGQSMGLWAAR